MTIKHFFGAGLYAKQMNVPAGRYIISHKHKYDHLSILAQGAVLLEVDGMKTRHVAPDCISIEAGKHHKVSALSDVVWFCLHPTSETDAEHVDDVLISEPDLPEVARLAIGEE